MSVGCNDLATWLHARLSCIKSHASLHATVGKSMGLLLATLIHARRSHSFFNTVVCNRRERTGGARDPKTNVPWTECSMDGKPRSKASIGLEYERQRDSESESGQVGVRLGHRRGLGTGIPSSGGR